jgi:hypothetical protein
MGFWKRLMAPTAGAVSSAAVGALRNDARSHNGAEFLRDSPLSSNVDDRRSDIIGRLLAHLDIVTGVDRTSPKHWLRTMPFDPSEPSRAAQAMGYYDIPAQTEWGKYIPRSTKGDPYWNSSGNN